MVEQEFPLREVTRNELQQLQQRLQLSEAELSSIEQPILAQKEAEKLKQQAEAER
ncbi:hypothetical protein [Leptodesmis sp.]|uniref:hypothetical protein n=1 Tax=Leptodesmis sp. TaxID=3100501 RepID=UPI0040535499